MIRAKLAPDGYQKDVIFIDAQFPGPMVEAIWGDRVVLQAPEFQNDKLLILAYKIHELSFVVLVI